MLWSLIREYRIIFREFELPVTGRNGCGGGVRLGFVGYLLRGSNRLAKVDGMVTEFDYTLTGFGDNNTTFGRGRPHWVTKKRTP